MAVKVYKTIQPGNISTVVKGVRILFSGMLHMPGTYSTNNVELQKAIESSPQYGKAFVLAYSSGSEPEVASVPEAEVTPEAETPKPKPAGRPKGSKQPEVDSGSSQPAVGSTQEN
jgi:hypothetical protein